MTDKRRSPLAVRLPEDLQAAVEEAAEKRGETVPVYVRSILASSTADKQPTKEHTAA